MTTQAEKFTEMADAIRIKTGKSAEIVANNFAFEIMTIDRLRPMNNYPNGLSCGYYGNRAARIAATYHLARVLEQDSFTYSTNSIFSDTIANERPVRDASGLGKIDCSTFVGLALRGIPYENSPYALYKGANAKWLPAEKLESMYGADGWEHIWFDKQPQGEYNSIGISGYSSLRLAADYGEYFYKYGNVLFDAKIDGAPIADLQGVLEPGDLIFWSKPDALESQKKRFRSISHVAIVAENTANFFEVTTGDSVVLCSKFSDKYENICLICRPDYRPRQIAESVPIGINLLTFPWTYSALRTSNKDGTMFTVISENTIHLSGTNTSQIDRTLKGSRDAGTGILLSAGTYQLSGMDNVGITHVGVALQIRNTDWTDFEEPIRCYTGHNPTFTISQDTNIIVSLHIGSNDGAGYTLDCDISPTLTRII